MNVSTAYKVVGVTTVLVLGGYAAYRYWSKKGDKKADSAKVDSETIIITPEPAPDPAPDPAPEPTIHVVLKDPVPPTLTPDEAEIVEKAKDVIAEARAVRDEIVEELESMDVRLGKALKETVEGAEKTSLAMHKAELRAAKAKEEAQEPAKEEAQEPAKVEIQEPAQGKVEQGETKPVKPTATTGETKTVVVGNASGENKTLDSAAGEIKTAVGDVGAGTNVPKPEPWVAKGVNSKKNKNVSSKANGVMKDLRKDNKEAIRRG